mgnify:CR=1 FL=1
MHQVIRSTLPTTIRFKKGYLRTYANTGTATHMIEYQLEAAHQRLAPRSAQTPAPHLVSRLTSFELPFKLL